MQCVLEGSAFLSMFPFGFPSPCWPIISNVLLFQNIQSPRIAGVHRMWRVYWELGMIAKEPDTSFEGVSWCAAGFLWTSLAYGWPSCIFVRYSLISRVLECAVVLTHLLVAWYSLAHVSPLEHSRHRSYQWCSAHFLAFRSIRPCTHHIFWWTTNSHTMKKGSSVEIRLCFYSRWIAPRSTCALFSRKNGLFPLQRVTRLLTQMHCSQG